MTDEAKEQLVRFFSSIQTSYDYAVKVPLEQRNARAEDFWKKINGDE